MAFDKAKVIFMLKESEGHPGLYKVDHGPNIKIPKWISDIFDKFIHNDNTRYYDFGDAWDYVVEENGPEEFEKWTSEDESVEISIAYLNPLTRKFVEVVG